ncbi:MAG: caspase family protein [Armatimonadetes bacterium]|nr:caspase family protein [Armatimonadota bacterium]
MQRWTIGSSMALGAALLMATLVVAGCGGGGMGDDPGVDPGAAKFDEFTGDGGGSAKPMPAFVNAPSDDADKRSPTRLRVGREPDNYKVREGRVNWFDTDLAGDSRHYVCLIEPTQPSSNMADPDLYVLYPLDNKASLDIPDPSRRAPSAGFNPPDWVAWDADDAGTYQVAVVGYDAAGASPPKIPFWLQLDRSRLLTPGGSARTGTLSRRDTKWYHFQAVAGTTYTVTLQTNSGDADLYVYGATSSDFIAGANASGTATDEVQFTAATSGIHHLRVYGYRGSDYRIKVRVFGGGGGGGTVTRRAVCVGISDYVGTGSDLSYCDDDARDFADALAASSNWNASNIEVIVDRQATDTNIWAALNSMAAASDSDDQCVFFFSGHGGRGTDYAPLDEPDDKDEYICETDLADNITDDQLGDWVAGLPTDNVLIVLCACFSGGAFKIDGVKSISPAQDAMDGFVDDIRAAMAARMRLKDVDDAGAGVVLAACKYNETCQESSSLQHDVFNYYVLEAMDGSGDADSDGLITAEEIYTYASPKATNYNPGQHAQIYDALPGSPMLLLDQNSPPPPP